MRRAIAAFGRFLVATGLLILAFVAFQLWGTGIVTARAQDDLRAKLDHQLATTTTTTPRPATTTSSPTTVSSRMPTSSGLFGAETPCPISRSPYCVIGSLPGRHARATQVRAVPPPNRRTG